MSDDFVSESSLKKKFLQGVPRDIELAGELLKSGKVVALPTETVYGLAADALNPDAVRQIFTIKGRPLMDPLIVHVLDLEHAAELAQIDATAQQLAEAFWPGPLTLILPKKPCVPDLVTANQPSVALRSPNHPLFRAVLRASGLCLAAPSANPFTYVSPTRAEHVQKTLGDRVPCIMDGGPCEHGLESTILSLLDPQLPIILRPGPITAEAIEAVIHRPVASSQAEIDMDDKNNPVSIAAPGLLKQHYSPKTPLYLCGHEELNGKDPLAAYVFWQRPETLNFNSKFIYWLTEDGSVEVAAKSLYHLLQTVDHQGHKAIFFENLPSNEGLYLALKNRLQKAANKFR